MNDEKELIEGNKRMAIKSLYLAWLFCLNAYAVTMEYKWQEVANEIKVLIRDIENIKDIDDL